MFKSRKLYALLLSLALVLAYMPVMAFAGDGVDRANEPKIRETDCEKPDEGNSFVYLSGEFNYLPKDEIIDYINEIRLEACEEGVPNPNDPSVKLGVNDYKPIKWSSDLEWIAQTRAAEAVVHRAHVRPNGSRWSSIYYNGTKSRAEDLAWNSTANIIGGINQWYDEKEDWVDQISDKVTGHYTSIINPNYNYIGIGAFDPDIGYGAVAGELGMSVNDNGEQTGSYGQYHQIIEVHNSALSAKETDPVTVHVTKDAELELTAETTYKNDLPDPWSTVICDVIPIGNAEWRSTDETVATVSDSGIVNGANPGNATVKAMLNDIEYSFDITVEDHKASAPVRENEVAAECEKDGHYDEVTYCKVCGSEISRETKPINALGHIFKDVEGTAVKPTCTEPGKKADRKCTRCDSFIEGETIEATGHRAGEAVSENEVPATIEAEGGFDSVVYCSNCHEELSRTHNTIDRLIDLNGAAVSGIGAKVYTGRAQTQAVAVVLDGERLAAGADYKVSYKNNTNVGTATLVVEGTGKYGGKLTRTFVINPKGTTLSKPKAAKKAFTAKWKKQAVQTTGYEIQYGLKKNFKGAKTVAVKKASAVSKKISKLKAKKKYYIRIRTYKTVGGRKYVSAWSSAKTVKTK
ncbi:MAG: Ig-like domain-containing protein [Mogibacterium sp.]|nr:Ig-like domain-containing protein [Mogibacterium sp.]